VPLISQAPGVPYRDKGTTMTGFKDWLTQISGAICHAPTGRRRRRSLPPLASVLSASASLHPFFGMLLPSLIGLQDHFSASVRQTPLNSKVNCEIEILCDERSPNSYNSPPINSSHRFRAEGTFRRAAKNWFVTSVEELTNRFSCLHMLVMRSR